LHAAPTTKQQPAVVHFASAAPTAVAVLLLLLLQIK
jgi:hypothetical protein